MFSEYHISPEFRQMVQEMADQSQNRFLILDRSKGISGVTHNIPYAIREEDANEWEKCNHIEVVTPNGSIQSTKR